MPGEDGTGPFGGGRMGGGNSAGLGGFCQCPKCGTKVEHKRAVPCSIIFCPKCGTSMIRA